MLFIDLVGFIPILLLSNYSKFGAIQRMKAITEKKCMTLVLENLTEDEY